MSPVGHSMVGLSVAALALPALRQRQRAVWGAVAFVAIANLPDWPLPSWGHDRYDISHSIFVNATLLLCIGAIYFVIIRVRNVLTARLVVGGALAWLSHLLLDSFYSHGKGVPVGWPLVDIRLNFPIVWFDTLDLSMAVWSPENLAVFGKEFITYLPILFLAVLARRWLILQKV